MDGIDGMQTARELRKRGCSSAIIFVTAFEDRVFDAFDIGAFNFLVKPLSAEKFSEVLQKAIESRSEPIANSTSVQIQSLYSDFVS